MDVPDWQVEGTMEHAQYEALKRSLEQARYRVAIAADILRVGRSTVYRLMKRFEIEVEDRAEELSPDAIVMPSTRKPQDRRQMSGEPKTVDVIFDGTNYLLLKR